MYNSRKRYRPDDSPGQTSRKKSRDDRYHLALIFPTTKALDKFVQRSRSVKDGTTIDGVFIQSIEKVTVAATAATEPAMLEEVMAKLAVLCRHDADIVVLIPSLISDNMKPSPGTCHKVSICRYSESMLPGTPDPSELLPAVREASTFKLLTSFTSTSRDSYILSCSSWGQHDLSLDGIARIGTDPHDSSKHIGQDMHLHLVATCIGVMETIKTPLQMNDVFEKHASNMVCTAAFELLRQLETSDSDISKAIHSASSLIVPESMLTTGDDDKNSSRVLPFPTNEKSLKRNQKLLSDFFLLKVMEHLYGDDIKQFAVALLGKETYEKIATQVYKDDPTSSVQDVIYQIYIEWKKVCGKSIDFSELKVAFSKIGHKELCDLCDTFYIEHAFSFELHRPDCHHQS